MTAAARAPAAAIEEHLLRTIRHGVAVAEPDSLHVRFENAAFFGWFKPRGDAVETLADRLVGCDLDSEAIACAARNVEAAGLANVELTDWDATQLPLPDASVDALTVDLPFGQLVGSHAANAELYPALFAEAARVARPGARLVAISQQVRLLERSLDRQRWTIEDVLRPTLSTSGGPIAPGIFVLTRTAS